MGAEAIEARVAEALGPERGAAFLAYRAAWRRVSELDEVTPGPLHLQIGLSEACNLRCPMCAWSAPGAVNKGRESWWALDRFRAVVAEVVALGGRSVEVNLTNEPLLRPDLPEFVAAARDLGGLDLWLHTNGMLLTPGMARGLMDAGLTRLLVSLDAVTAATYAPLRPGGDLDVVQRHIRAFLAARAARGARLPLLGVCFVQMAGNAHELAAFRARWAGVADCVVVQTYLDPRLGDPATAALAPARAAPPDGFRCPQPFQRLAVDPAGVVRPCCSEYGARMPLGDLRTGTGSVAAAWTSPAMQALRALHRRGGWREHPVCRACVTAAHA